MKKNAGFTLIELIVTVAIAAIVLTLGVPTFETLFRSNRLTAHANDLTSSLNLARSEAIKRGRNVVVCKSTSGTACTPTGAGTGWEQGWIVFIDRNGNGQVDADADPTLDDMILRVYVALTGNDTLTGSASVQDAVSYVGSGFTTLAADGTFTFSLCDGQNNTRQITVSTRGRSQVSSIACP